MKERLQKVLAHAGLGSRREIDGWIQQGRIAVNGAVAEPGLRVSPDDRILLDGKPLRLDQALPLRDRVLLYHKPAGEVCTRSDPEGRPTVFQHVPRLKQGRWLTVGRLDINTSGLLLLTNNGELANRLMHPSHEVEREYAVRILGQVPPEVFARLREGVMLEDGPAAFDDILDAGGEGANHWFHVILREGRNREVRRLWESQGFAVSRLIRVRYGNIELPRALRPGKWQELTPPQLGALRRLVGMKAPARPAAASAKRGGGQRRSRRQRQRSK